jgi:hypothetical protein
MKRCRRQARIGVKDVMCEHFKSVASFILMVALATPSFSYGATLIGTPSSASGLSNLQVDGNLYDVQFSNQAFTQVYASSVPIFDGNLSLASDATIALVSALNSLGVSGFADFSPANEIYVPAGPASVFPGLPEPYLFPAFIGIYDYQASTWSDSGFGYPQAPPPNPDELAVFTTAAPAPLKPSIWANLIFGFLGLGWIAYRRKNQSALTTA